MPLPQEKPSEQTSIRHARLDLDQRGRRAHRASTYCISDPNREVHLRLLAAPQPDRRERSFLTKPDLFPADTGPQFIEEPATQRPRDASLQLNAASRPLIDGDEPLVFRDWL